MTDPSADTVVSSLRAVLREAFEGPQADWTYFIDNRPDAAVFGTLEKLTAAEASAADGSTASIAGHVHHLAFALADSSAWIRGERTTVDWKESWRVKAVDEAAWTRLRARLRREYEGLLRAIETTGLADAEALGGAVGAVAHVGYHLGAIRQKLPRR